MADDIVADAAKLIELLVRDCGVLVDKDHEWRKCPRCLAIAAIERHDKLSMKLLQAALSRLRYDAPTS